MSVNHSSGCLRYSKHLRGKGVEKKASKNDHVISERCQRVRKTTNWEIYGITVYCRGFNYILVMFSMST